MVDRADAGFFGVVRSFGDICQQLSAGSVYLQSLLKETASFRAPGFAAFAGEIATQVSYQASKLRLGIAWLFNPTRTCARGSSILPTLLTPC